VRSDRRTRDIGVDVTGGSTLAAARHFYCHALGGRQVRRVTRGDGSSMLRFLVSGELLTTGPSAANDRVTLIVDDVMRIAERCWDAGFEVRVGAADDDGSIVVIDPFDLELELISSGSEERRRAVAAEER
jgi:catechol 2,3-dioxygenase-like lactoylglutathione lyase family enzyme